ncbi:hypothetical protein [Calothrix sp. 336/3]|nr:hypothetical protein [Calothrix sp. 336/3]
MQLVTDVTQSHQQLIKYRHIPVQFNLSHITHTQSCFPTQDDLTAATRV